MLFDLNAHVSTLFSSKPLNGGKSYNTGVEFQHAVILILTM